MVLEADCPAIVGKSYSFFGSTLGNRRLMANLRANIGILVKNTPCRRRVFVLQRSIPDDAGAKFHGCV